MSKYTLSNDVVTVVIESLGAELKSLVKDGCEYMWKADPAFWGRTSPVLFPNVGSLKDKTYICKGSSYSLGQHGFARDMEFTCVEQTEDSITFSLESSETTKVVYPYEFKLCITYTLLDSGVRIDWVVDNTGDEDLHFSIGGHPAFSCDLNGSSFVLCDGSGKPVDTLLFHLLNSNGTVNPAVYTKQLQDGKLIMSPELFDHDALICVDQIARKIGLLNPEGKLYLTVTMDEDCDIFGLWSPTGKNAPFVCIEPWYGTADYQDTDSIWETKKHSQALKPGDIFKKGFDIEI